MTIVERITLLRQKMSEYGFDAYFIPTSDPHQCEYLAEHDKARVFISGFTGSAGSVVVTQTAALLWTDGRYFLQAEQELKGSGIALQKSGEPDVPSFFEYLAETLPAGSIIAMDGKVISADMFRLFKTKLPDLQFDVSHDLIGEIWHDRPAPVLSKAFIHELRYTGKSAAEKIAAVRAVLKEKGADATVIGALEDVCYVFNIRGNDIEATPVVTAYALIDMHNAYLYIDERQMTDTVREALKKEGVTVAAYDAVFADAGKLAGTVYLDPARTNVFLRNAVTAEIIEGLNITAEMKAVKNDVELTNYRNAFLKDGIAMVKILKWVEEQCSSGITEWDVSEQLLQFRSEQPDFLEVSFTTIAGYGTNAAVIHYSPKKDTAAAQRLSSAGFRRTVFGWYNGYYPYYSARPSHSRRKRGLYAGAQRSYSARNGEISRTNARL